jgi:F-type H+-transporting ATPase subunit epsilon
MANAVAFTLITPRATVFEGDAELVIVTGTEGEVGILPSHAPFLTALRSGVLRANVRDGSGIMRIELACGEGFLQALPDKITVLTDAAFAANEVDVGTSREEIATAQHEQREAGGDLAAWHRAQSKIDFASAKLKVVGVTS